MKKNSILLTFLALSGCAADPVVQVQAPPAPALYAPMTATAVRAATTTDGVIVPAHNAQALISGIEPLPVEPLPSQDAFWIVANETIAPPPVATKSAAEKRDQVSVKKTARKPSKPPVKYVCKPVKETR